MKPIPHSVNLEFAGLFKHPLRPAVAANPYSFVLVTTLPASRTLAKPITTPHGTSRPLPLSSKIIDHHHPLQRQPRSPTLFSFIGEGVSLPLETPKNEVYPVGNRAAIRDSSNERRP
jgi:hypothetical protein